MSEDEWTEGFGCCEGFRIGSRLPGGMRAVVDRDDRTYPVFLCSKCGVTQLGRSLIRFPKSDRGLAPSEAVALGWRYEADSDDWRCPACVSGTLERRWIEMGVRDDLTDLPTYLLALEALAATGVRPPFRDAVYVFHVGDWRITFNGFDALKEGLPERTFGIDFRGFPAGVIQVHEHAFIEDRGDISVAAFRRSLVEFIGRENLAKNSENAF